MNTSHSKHSLSSQKPSLIERAAALKASVARLMRERLTHQPSPETLLEGSTVEGVGHGFPTSDLGSHDHSRGCPSDLNRNPAAKGCLPRQETNMGRHETFYDFISVLAAGQTAGPLFQGSPGALLPALTPETYNAADPILALIAETRRLTAERAAAAALPQPAHTIDPLPEQSEACEAFFAHVDKVLLKTVPTTAAGCAALARYAVEFLEAEGYALDEDAGNDQHVRILDLIARSPLRLSTSLGHGVPDPVFSAINRYRAARDIADAFCDRLEREGWDALGGVKAASEEAARLDRIWSSLATEVLKIVPITEAGRLALADFIDAWVDGHGHLDGSPQDGELTVFGEVYPALLTALRAPLNGRG